MADSVRVVMLDPDWFGDVEREREVFEKHFENVTLDAVDCTEEEIPEKVGSADILLSHYTGVSRESMEATGCSVITRYATGVDGIHIDAATEHKIRVTNVPHYCDSEVGNHVLTLALAVIRGIPQYDSMTETGEWDWDRAKPIEALDELTFGFLAFGNKAQAAASQASKLGFDILAHDPYLEDSEILALDATPVSYDDLLKNSNVLSINTPLTPETEGMIDADAFEKLPDNSVIVNTSRGKVINEDALLDALASNKVKGAGLDVLAEEPPKEENPLLDRDDVIVTPHAAWYSERSAEKLRRLGSEIAIAAYNGENHEGIVNPEALE